MGFFKHKYSVPGKGLTPEQAMERSYFGILCRKLTKIAEISSLYVFSNIVQIIALLFMVLPFFVSVDDKTNAELGRYVAEILSGKKALPVYYFVPFMLMGPTSAGINYICRNFAKQEPCFVWSDFWKASKNNFLQGLLAGIAIGLTYYFYINAALFYFNSSLNKILVLAIAINLGLLITFTLFYVYPIMVTFEMKLGKIFKNAFIMAFLNLPLNLAAFVSVAAVNFLLITNLPAIVWMPVSVFFLIGWASYTVNYVVWTAIDKFMISK